jgi:DNA-binding MarR family transcriptional regulator
MANGRSNKIKIVLSEISLADNSFLNASMAIGIAASIIERKTNSLLKPHHLNHNGFMCLYLLTSKGGSASLPEITAKTYLTRQAVSSSTRELEKQGLIERIGAKNDKRKLRIVITEKGLDLMRVVGTDAGRRQMLDVLTSVLTSEEAEMLAQILNRITKKTSRLRPPEDGETSSSFTEV